jgi:hypothetical protein
MRPYVIIGFDLGDAKTIAAGADVPFIAPHMRDGWSVFWNALNILKLMGLVEVVFHLFDNAGESAEILHPYAMPKTGEPIEREIARNAHAAGSAMMGEDYDIWLVPVERHRADATLIGIFRLRYKPHTKMSAAWIMSQSELQCWAEKYRDLACRNGLSIEEYSRKTA